VNEADENAFRQRLGQVESLIQRLEQCADAQVRADAKEVVRTLLDLHGAGLSRMLALLAETGESGRALLGAFADDELIGSLLLLHGLHPVDVETRVRQALAAMRQPGGAVELVAVNGGTVRLRLRGNWESYSSSAGALRAALEEAIWTVAPDVTGIEIDGLSVLSSESRPGLVSLPLLGARDSQ
jgi:Fe-S cluster biogenesis protein NfuA